MNKTHISATVLLLLISSHSVLATGYETTELYTGYTGRLNYKLLTNIYLQGAKMTGPSIDVYHHIPGLTSLPDTIFAECMTNLNAHDTGTASITYKSKPVIEGDALVCRTKLTRVHDSTMARLQSIITISGDNIRLNQSANSSTSVCVVYSPSNNETIRKVEHSISSPDTGYARVIDTMSTSNETIINDGPSAAELGREWAFGNLVARYPTSIELDAGQGSAGSHTEDLLALISNGPTPTVDVKYQVTGLNDLVHVGMLDQAGNIEPGWSPNTPTVMGIDRRVGVALNPNAQVSVGRVNGTISLTLTVN